MKGPYQDQDNYVEGIGFTPDPELNSEDITERDGYRDTQRIVDEFISAGERLERFRKEEFDNELESEEIELPITRSNGFDMAEASMILNSEKKRLEETMKNKVVKEEEKEEKVEKEEKPEV